MLTAAQKTLVQTSFATIVPIADDAAALFYQRLFELDPSLQAHVPGQHDRAAQEADADADRGGEGTRPPRAAGAGGAGFGRRHATYGVAEAHYDTVGAALLWTLEMGLGAAFTAETREAWTAVYGLLATTMQDAAREALAAA